MIESASINAIPPFSYGVKFEFDEHVNLFIGPNASGKSTFLRKLADQTQSDDFNFDFDGHQYPEYRSRMSWELYKSQRNRYQEQSRQYAQQMPWVFIPPVRLNIPFSDGTRELLSEKNRSQQDLSQILNIQESQDVFDGKAVYLAAEAINQQFITESDTSKIDNMIKSRVLPYKCARNICRDVLLDNPQGDYTQSIPLLVERNVATTVVHHDMGVSTIDVKDRKDDQLFLGDLSYGTQGTLLWIWYLALKMAHHYDFADGWEEQPAVLLIDEIENHLHPTWQRRVIPELRKHFPGVQIFATTHSPFMVAGLKAGQIHILKRTENRVAPGPPQERDIIGWTVSEILRGLMDVDDPTDEQTAINAARLRDLRRKRASDGLSDDEETEMRELHKRVNSDMLAKGALNAQRDRLANTMQDFLQSRLAKTLEE